VYIKNPYARILIRKDKIVLCNTKTGAFVRTRQTYYKDLERYLEGEKPLASCMEEKLEYLFSELCKIEYYISKEKYNEVFHIPMQVVYLSVTNRCNLKCKHCIASAVDVNHADTLDTEEWKRIIDQVAKLRPDQITITGGEPLVRPDFTELIRYAGKIFGKDKVILSTNSLLINESNIEDIISNVSAISISLDGYDERSCAAVRGRGVFQKVINSVNFIKANEYSNIFLSMLESAYTQEHADEFFSLCKKLGAKPILRRFSPTGRGEKYCDELMPGNEQEEPLQSENLTCMLCRPGRKELNISADGKVYPCAPLSVMKKLCMGDLKENSLDKILNPMKAENMVEHLRPWRVEVCKNCDVNLFCHNCIDYIMAIKRNSEQFKKMCNKTKAELEKIIWED